MDKPPANIYNSRLRRGQQQLKLWRYVGLMLTYKCPASCEFCYYSCGPDKSGLMPVDTAISAWQSMVNIAGPNAKVHITGGEPFLYFDRLAEIMTEANKTGLTPLDSIETNAFWATDDNIITERLHFLKNNGLDRLKISWDPFHAEFIDSELVKRLARVASNILGPERVLVRWEKYLQQPVSFPISSAEKRTEIYRSAMKDYSNRFTGRAARTLAESFAEKDCQTIAQKNCKKSFLSAKGLHIDPYGNVFNGLCSGIIINNINDTTLDRFWEQFDPKNAEFVRFLYDSGPTGLMEEAQKLGYQKKTLYSDKCHLCTHIRQFFFDIGMYKQIIGPCDCYSP